MELEFVLYQEIEVDYLEKQKDLPLTLKCNL